MNNAMPNDPDPLHDKAEAAQRLKSGVRTVDRYRSEGLISYVRIGHRIFIPESSIRDFLARSTRPAVVGRKQAA